MIAYVRSIEMMGVMQIRAIPSPSQYSDCNTDWEAILSATRLQLLLALSPVSSSRRDGMSTSVLGNPQDIATKAGQQLGSLPELVKMKSDLFALALTNAVSLFKPVGLTVALDESQAAAVGRLLNALVAAQAALGTKSSASDQAAMGPNAQTAQQLIDTFQLLAVAAMRGRGPNETYFSASKGADASTWMTAKRVSLEGTDLDSGSVVLKNTCNSSIAEQCSEFNDFAFVVTIPSEIRDSIAAQLKDQAPKTVDIVVTAFSSNLFAFFVSSTTYGPSIRFMMLRALNTQESAPSDIAITVSAISQPIKARRRKLTP
jgi:hypothetical protein